MNAAAVLTHKSSSLGAQIAPIPCPCCQRPLAVPTLETVVFHYEVKPQEARILRAVWNGRGLPVNVDRIFDVMYEDDPDGGPGQVKMYSAFKESLHRLRRRLEGSGIAIENSGYRGGYRLVMGVVQKEKA